MSYQRPTPTVGAAAAATTAPLVPYACYTCVVLGAKPAVGKNHPFNKRADLEIQILAPDTITNTNGTVSQPGGVKGTLMLTFSEANMQNCIDALQNLGLKFPPPQSSFEEDVEALRAAAIAQLPLTVFDMRVNSKREEVKNPDGSPMLDSRQQPIVGQERADFNMFNIVGNPRTVEQAASEGIAMQQPPY
jgi:hypothetical protein